MSNMRWIKSSAKKTDFLHYTSPYFVATFGNTIFLIARSLQTWDRRVRPRLGLRHGTPLASRGVPGETGHLSSSIWNLGVFSRRCTGESLPLRVDFIHRAEFEEVSGHRDLIKRGPGNRGPSECGTTHEATR